MNRFGRKLKCTDLHEKGTHIALVFWTSSYHDIDVFECFYIFTKLLK